MGVTNSFWVRLTLMPDRIPIPPCRSQHLYPGRESVVLSIGSRPWSHHVEQSAIFILHKIFPLMVSVVAHPEIHWPTPYIRPLQLIALNWRRSRVSSHFSCIGRCVCLLEAFCSCILLCITVLVSYFALNFSHTSTSSCFDYLTTFQMCSPSVWRQNYTARLLVELCL